MNNELLYQAYLNRLGQMYGATDNERIQALGQAIDDTRYFRQYLDRQRIFQDSVAHRTDRIPHEPRKPDPTRN